jgi:hypothetical protein
MSKGAIRNPDAYLKAAIRRRTERFDDCFPRNISLGDIDSYVEINNHFLFLEWKVANQEIQRGQWMALIRQSRQPRTTVIAIWTTEEGVITHAQKIGEHPTRRVANEERVFAVLKEWAATADQADHNITVSQ